MKKILPKVLIVVVAIFIGAIVFEGLARIFLPRPVNLTKLETSSTLIHKNRGNTSFIYTSGAEDGGQKRTIEINSEGFRDNPFKVDKDEGTVRVAVLGDSYEEGIQVDLDKTWQKLLASKLSNNYQKKFEVYNFGVSGYGTDQEWITLKEKVWKFKPDLVILAFTTNDVGDVYKNGIVKINDKGDLVVLPAVDKSKGNVLGNIVRGTYVYNYLGSFSRRSEILSKLFSKFRTKILGFAKEEKFFLSDAQLVSGPFEVIATQKNPPHEVSETWRIISKIFSEIQKEADSHGAKFMITSNLGLFQVNDDNWKSLKTQYSIPEDSTSDEMQKRLEEVANSDNIAFCNTLNSASDWISQKGPIHFQSDQHYNQNGHEFMADTVNKCIVEKGLF